MGDLESFLPTGRGRTSDQVLPGDGGRRLGHKQPYVGVGDGKARATPELPLQPQKQVEHLAGTMGRAPIVVTPTTPSSTATGVRGPAVPRLLFRKMHFDQTW